MTVSIIIATKTWQKNLRECIGKCLKLDYPDFEILILPDEKNGDEFQMGSVSISIIPTGAVSPAKKRDIALLHAKGEILAFIDDDAYPREDWLKNAVKNFLDPEVAAVGGPAITPQNDSLRQRASGQVFASSFVSARFRYRYLIRKRRQVRDYPSCNFLVRRSIMQELGGFQTNFWPGEDTKLCLDIINKLGKRIIYDPEVVVWHHRRPLYLTHLKQVASYALHRGYFVKKYPATSCRPSYFIPTIFLLTVGIGGFLSLYDASLRIFYFWGLFLYLTLVFIFSICKEWRLIPLVFLGIISTHLAYGVYFLKGLILPRLKEEL